ncbi:unnamed protein product [Lampetra planeri]
MQATISFNRSPSWDQEKSLATIVYTRPSIWEQQHTEPITKPGRIVSLAREKKEGGGAAGPPSQPRAHRPPHQSPSDLPAATHSAKVMAAGVSMTTIHENEELPSTLPRVSSRRTQGGWAATPSWNTVPRHHYSHVQGAGAQACLHHTCLHHTWLNHTCLHHTCLQHTCLQCTCLQHTCLQHTCLHHTCLQHTCLLQTAVHGGRVVETARAGKPRPLRRMNGKNAAEHGTRGRSAIDER